MRERLIIKYINITYAVLPISTALMSSVLEQWFICILQKWWLNSYFRFRLQIKQKTFLLEAVRNGIEM